MATSLGVIEAVLRLRDELTPTLRRVATSMDDVGNTVRRNGQAVRELGSSMTIGLTAPIVAAAAGSLKFASDFEATMTKVGSLTAIGTSGVAEMRAEILKLAPTVGIGPQALAEGLLVVASTGLQGAAAVDVLTQAAKASAIGLGETKDVARAITSALKAYGEENITAEEVTKKLFVAVKEGGAEADEFAGTLGRVVGIASQVGVSFDEVLAAMATFTRLGVDAAEAATGLRATMTSILSPSNEAREQLQALGTSIDELRKSVREKGLAQAMIELVQLTKGNDDAISAIIPNVRALSAIMGTAGSQAEGYVQSLSNIKNASTEVTDAFGEAGKTMRFTWNQAMAEAQALAIQFGNTIAPVFRDVIPHVRAFIATLGDTIKWFTQLPAPIQTATLAFVALAAALGPLTYLFGNMMVIGGGLAGLVGKIGASLLGMSTAASAATAATTVMNAEIAAANTFFGLTTGAMNTTTVAAGRVALGIGGITTAIGLMLGPIAAATYGLYNLFKLKDDKKALEEWARSGAFAVGELGAVVQDFSKKAPVAISGMSQEIKGTADQVLKIISGMQLASQVEALSVAFNRLTDAGRPTEKQFAEVAKQARMLRDQGAELPDWLASIADSYKDIKAVGGAAAKSTKELTDEQKQLLKTLTGGGVQSVKDLEAAWLSLSPTQRENRDIIERVLEQYERMRDIVGTQAAPAIEKLFRAQGTLKNSTLDLGDAMLGVTTGIRWWMDATTKANNVTRGFTEDGVIPAYEATQDLFKASMEASVGLKVYTDRAMAATSETRKASSEAKSFGDKIRSAVIPAVEDLNRIFMAAFEGGGGLSGAIQSFATKALSNLLALIPGVGAFLSQFAGAIVAGVKKLFGGLFGGPSEMEKAGRKAAEDFTRGLASGLSDAQIVEAQASGNFKWAASVIAVRDAYLAVGRTEAEALSVMDRLWRAEKQGADAVRKVVDEINEAFAEQKRLTEFLETTLPDALNDIAESGGIISKEFKAILATIEATGQATEALDAFFSGQAVRAAKGLADALRPAADAMGSVKDKQEELRLAMSAMNDAQREFGTGSDKYEDAAEKVRALSAEVGVLTGVIGTSAVQNQASADAFGNAIAGAFAVMIERGMSATDALKAISPSVDALRTQLEFLGFSGTAAFDRLAAMAQLASDKVAGPALESVNALGEALVGLSNSGILTQEVFAGLTNQITTTFQDMIAQGFDAEHVMAIMQPTLQTIWELMEEFGFEVDAATLELIEQAKQAGLVGEAHRSAQEKAQAAMERVATAMERVADVLERAFGDAGDQAELLASRANAAIDSIPRDITVNVHFNMDDLPDFSDFGPSASSAASGSSYGVNEFLRDNPGDFDRARDIYGDLPGFSHGTDGRYVDFGSGTPVMLHGREKITPEGQGGGGRIEIPVYLNGREIARAVAEDLPDVLSKMGVQ